MPPARQPDVYIACFADAAGWGGALTVARRISTELNSMGLNPYLLGVKNPQADAAPLPRGAENAPLAPPPVLWRIQNWFVIPQLERYLRKLPPPRHTFAALSMYWLVAAKKVWPEVRAVYLLPCVLTNNLPFNRRPNWGTVWNRADFAAIRRAEHLAFALADTIVAPCEAARDEVIQFHPTAADRIKVALGGFDPADVSPDSNTHIHDQLGGHPDDILFFSVGVYDQNKGFDLAIRALPHLDSRVRFVAVGSGQQESSLLQLANRLGVADRVHLVGRHNDVAPWFAAADVVISTSHYDMFPGVIKEGMSAGRPVLVPYHDPPRVYAGIAEVIAQFGGGILYDRTQPDALVAAMENLARDHNHRRSLGAEAAGVAQRLAGWQHHVRCILNTDVSRASQSDPTPMRTSHTPDPEISPANVDCR